MTRVFCQQKVDLLDAVRWDGTEQHFNETPILHNIGISYKEINGKPVLSVPTSIGEDFATAGQWIIKGKLIGDRSYYRTDIHVLNDVLFRHLFDILWTL